MNEKKCILCKEKIDVWDTLITRGYYCLSCRHAIGYYAKEIVEKSKSIREDAREER